MHISPFLIAGLLALLFTYAIAYEMRWVAQGLGAMAPPGGRHIHTHPVPRRVKFPLIYAIATIPVWFGMTTDFMTHPVTGAVVPLGMAGKVFTVVWLGSMAIAMNSIDGVDGLAAGVSVITGMTLLSAAAS